MARDRDIVDKYSGGGTGNWKRAPKKAEAKKKRGVATTEAVKKMKRKESSVPKPKAKPGSDSPKSGASRSTKGKVSTSAKSGASRSTKGKVSTSAKSGASRSVKGKVDNSVGARIVRGAKRLFTNKGKETGNPNFKATSPGGIKTGEEKKRTVTRGSIGRKSSKSTPPKSDKKKNPRTMRGGRS